MSVCSWAGNLTSTQTDSCFQTGTTLYLATALRRVATVVSRPASSPVRAPAENFRPSSMRGLYASLVRRSAVLVGPVGRLLRGVRPLPGRVGRTDGRAE